MLFSRGIFGTRAQYSYLDVDNNFYNFSKFTIFFTIFVNFFTIFLQFFGGVSTYRTITREEPAEALRYPT